MTNIDPILTEAEVLRLAGIGRTTRWKLERDGKFPARVRLSPGRVGWKSSQIQTWIEERQQVASPERVDGGAT